MEEQTTQLIQPLAARESRAQAPGADALDPRVWDGFTLSYAPREKLKISPKVRLHTETAAQIDPIAFEVIRNALWILNEEHADTIRKVGASPVASFANDLNTSIQTEIGEAVMFAPYVQYFAGVADIVVQWTLENRGENPGIEEGDVFFQNDPLIGVSHQMDVQTFAPVFIDGALFCWVFNSVHVRDIGGTEPSSFCVEAKDVYGEATPIPPIKLAERGRLRADVEQMIRRHSRIPGLLALDLRSQLAGVHAAINRARELVARYGAATVKAAMRKIMDDASAAVSRRLSRIPDGTWHDVTYLGALSRGDRRAHRVTMTMTKTGDQLLFSNEGTETEFGSANCSFGAWRAAIANSMSALLAWDHRYCTGGVLKHASFRPVPGTINCIDRSGAVSNLLGIMSSVAMSATVLSKMLACDEELRTNQMAVKASSAWTGMSGIDQWGQPYATVSLDEIASGCGAFSFRDGIDQGGTYTIPRSEAGDCEVWEQASPILYLFRRFSMGFGHGKYRGGRGIVLGWVGRGTDTQVMSAASIPLSLPGANGLWGGHCGQAGFFMSAQNCGIAQTMADGGLPGSVEKLREIVKLTAVPPKSVGVPLLHDDVWVMDIGSAGGYGDPIKRDPQAVLEDILDGLPIAQAAQIYGVIIAGDSVDAASTEQRRREIRQQRLTRALPPIQSIQRPAPNGGEKLLFQMGGELKVTEIDGRAYIVCVDCGHYLCEAAGNYKLGCGRINGSLNELDDSLYGGDACEELDDVMVYRSYICPGCGVLIENELARGYEPLFWDVRLNPRPQEG
jgi:N-methylhydantoinase B